MNCKNRVILVGVIMGSETDWNIMQHTCKILDFFSVSYEKKVISAHRMPHDMVSYGNQAYTRGLRAIIAGAGGAAHLPGMIAALTAVPVFGVPIPSKYLSGQDSLLSIVQMPKGIPVATFAIGESGAINAAIQVVSCLSMMDNVLYEKLICFREKQTQDARKMSENLPNLI